MKEFFYLTSTNSHGCLEVKNSLPGDMRVIIEVRHSFLGTQDNSIERFDAIILVSCFELEQVFQI